jgi:hypothetical protein
VKLFPIYVKSPTFATPFLVEVRFPTRYVLLYVRYIQYSEVLQYAEDVFMERELSVAPVSNTGEF